MNRRLSLIVLLTSIFAIGVLVWYFFFVTPQSAPSLASTSLPFSSLSLPARFGFILNGFQASTSTTEITPQTEQPLVEIWDKPTTGNVFITRNIIKEIDSTSTSTNSTSTVINVRRSVHATSTVLMFVDRATGYVYGHNMDTGTTYQISNTTIPGVYDAYIFNNGKQILFRYPDNDRQNIIGVLATIPNVEETGNATSLETILSLPKNISSVAVSASSNKLSYVVKNNNGSAIYTITTKGQSLTAVSPFSEWSLSYGGEQLYATSKPSAYVEGSTVLVPSFIRLVGNKTGLISNPSSDGTIINSMLSNAGLSNFIFSNKGATITLPIKTLASKCAWGSGTFIICAIPQLISQTTEGLPDDWYQGRVQFADTLSFVDIKNGNASPFYSFDSKLGDMDVTHMNISSNNILIGFIRKQDSTLWLLNTGITSAD